MAGWWGLDALDLLHPQERHDIVQDGSKLAWMLQRLCTMESGYPTLGRRCCYMEQSNRYSKPNISMAWRPVWDAPTLAKKKKRG